ncbi:MAG: PilZ domain-containing protein [Candidatus Omnitrophota bacterium]
MERRKYIRLTSVFPVSLQFFRSQFPSGRTYQGFTRNVSIEGLCVEVSDLDDDIKNNLGDTGLSVRLSIFMPLADQPAYATAKIIWTKPNAGIFPNQYLLGIDYSQIEQSAKKRIFNYAKRVRAIPQIVTATIICLLMLSGVSLSREYTLRQQNRTLIKQAVTLALEQSQLEQKLWMAQHREEGLKGELSQSLVRHKQLQAQLSPTAVSLELEQELAGVKAQSQYLDHQLSLLAQEKIVLRSDLDSLTKQRQEVTQDALASLYRWLKTHQLASTGLVISFEGDSFLKNWAFTYDQSLSAQVFTLYGDYERAKRIFDFYNLKAQHVDGGFVNAYEVDKGSVTEYMVHAGPNIWLGIALAQYTDKTKDTQYMNLAARIADWVIRLQEQDSDFGIKGGPGLTWYSTEHNLDAYAFFKMLYALTGETRYQAAAERSLAWLSTHAYNTSDPPINRGKGDATIATDTFSWAICSLGPETLLKGEMNPEQIISFAEENCAVEVQYRRPSGEKVTVKGFDFSKFSNTPRGGVVSTEWTAQMIVAYQVMASFFAQQSLPEKADGYREKANFYLNELSKMVICSPSKTGQGEGCLPYASVANADTGHGWRTPQGDRTGSLAGTAYAIFAFKAYNPLFLSR